MGVDVAEHDGWAVVAISGQVDLATRSGVEGAHARPRHERPGAPGVRPHRHRVLDSTALGALVSVFKRCGCGREIPGWCSWPSRMSWGSARPWADLGYVALGIVLGPLGAVLVYARLRRDGVPAPSL